MQARTSVLPLIDDDSQKKMRRPKQGTNAAAVVAVVLFTFILLGIFFGSHYLDKSTLHARVLPRPTETKLKAIEEDGAFLQSLIAKELTDAEEKEKEQGYEDHAYNLFIGDRLSLHRQFKDIRQPQCFEQTFDVFSLPSTSVWVSVFDLIIYVYKVIIIFHNEAATTLLRTIHSVRDKSPPLLLKEVCDGAPELIDNTTHNKSNQSLIYNRLFW